MERRTADAELRGHCASDRAFEIGRPLGRHDATDIVGARLVQHLNAHAHIVAGDHGVTIDPDDDFAGRATDRRVQAGRGLARGIIDDEDAWVLTRDEVGYLAGAVL